jgi:E3 SUMO-protein ligase NSE2
VNNDYRSFKRTVHDAMHPGEDAPPVPHPSTWFSLNETPGPQTRQPRTSTDDANDEPDEEDDVIIAGATKNLKCPLTLQTFIEPYSNNVCSHSFEKATIIEYLHANGVAFVPPNQRRGQRTAQGPKQVKCPTVGCDAVSQPLKLPCVSTNDLVDA